MHVGTIGVLDGLQHIGGQFYQHIFQVYPFYSDFLVFGIAVEIGFHHRDGLCASGQEIGILHQTIEERRLPRRETTSEHHMNIIRRLTLFEELHNFIEGFLIVLTEIAIEQKACVFAFFQKTNEWTTRTVGVVSGRVVPRRIILRLFRRIFQSVSDRAIARIKIFLRVVGLSSTDFGDEVERNGRVFVDALLNDLLAHGLSNTCFGFVDEGHRRKRWKCNAWRKHCTSFWWELEFLLDLFELVDGVLQSSDFLVHAFFALLGICLLFIETIERVLHLTHILFLHRFLDTLLIIGH